jgi:hypothetical protein
LAEVAVKKLMAAFWLSVAAAVAPCLGFAWGHEGHQIVALIAEKNMTPAALARAQAILGGASLEDVASWADDYRRDHPETGPWHYIDIPLADSRIDMARECPDGQCVIAQTEHFLSVLKDPKADTAAKAEALRFVVHFVGDLHQPLAGFDPDWTLTGQPRVRSSCSGCRQHGEHSQPTGWKQRDARLFARSPIGVLRL